MSKYSDFDDVKLLELIKLNSDKVAYATIFKRYNGLIYSHVYNKVRNQQDSEDILQDIFVKFWAKRENLDLNFTFPGYLFLVARNLVIDYVRKKRIGLNSENIFITSSNNVGVTPDLLLREKEFSLMIEYEISQLPPRMREVFELKRQKFLTVKEISQELGISEATVATHMKSALKILRLKFKNKSLLMVFLTL